MKNIVSRGTIAIVAWIGLLGVVVEPLLVHHTGNQLYAASGSNGNGIQAGSAIEIDEPSVAVPVDGLWQEFQFGAAGTFATACTSCVPSSSGNSQFVGAPPWTFTAGPNGVNLIVTDAFSIGDQFEVFDNAVSLGLTSAPGTGSCGDDPVPCSTNPAVSKRTFNLGPGNHSITIKVTLSPSGGGAAYFRVVTATAPAGPVCNVVLNNTTFSNGNTVIAQTVQITNPTASPVAIEFKFWFEVPGSPPIPFAGGGADGSVVLPAGFNQNVGPLTLFTVTSAFPRGTYAFNCRFLHPVTGGLLAEDLNPFQVQ